MVLSGVSFFNDIHSETILALLPMFMVQVLGISKSLIGLIEGLAAATPSLLNPVAGWLSDRLQRRKAFLVCGYTLSTVAKVFAAFAQGFGHILAVRVTDRVGKGLRTAPRDALLSLTVTTRHHGRTFGFHRMADTLGAVVGSALAFALLKLLQGDYRATFLWAAISGVLSVLLLVICVTEIRPSQGPKKETATADFSTLPASFNIFLAAHALFSLGNFTYVFFLLRAQAVGIAAVTIPLLYLLYNLVYALAAFPAGRLADAIGVRPTLIGAYLLFALTCLTLAFSDSPGAMWGWFVLYGLHSASVNPASRAMVTNLVKPEARGTGLGLMHGVGAGFSLLSSIIAGLLWERYSSQVPFVFGAICTIAAALVLVWSLPGGPQRAK